MHDRPSPQQPVDNFEQLPLTVRYERLVPKILRPVTILIGMFLPGLLWKNVNLSKGIFADIQWMNAKTLVAMSSYNLSEVNAYYLQHEKALNLTDTLAKHLDRAFPNHPVDTTQSDPTKRIASKSKILDERSKLSKNITELDQLKKIKHYYQDVYGTLLGLRSNATKESHLYTIKQSEAKKVINSKSISYTRTDMIMHRPILDKKSFSALAKLISKSYKEVNASLIERRLTTKLISNVIEKDAFDDTFEFTSWYFMSIFIMGACVTRFALINPSVNYLFNTFVQPSNQEIETLEKLYEYSMKGTALFMLLVSYASFKMTDNIEHKSAAYVVILSTVSSMLYDAREFYLLGQAEYRKFLLNREMNRKTQQVHDYFNQVFADTNISWKRGKQFVFSAERIQNVSQRAVINIIGKIFEKNGIAAIFCINANTLTVEAHLPAAQAQTINTQIKEQIEAYRKAATPNMFFTQPQPGKEKKPKKLPQTDQPSDSEDKSDDETKTPADEKFTWPSGAVYDSSDPSCKIKKIENDRFGTFFVSHEIDSKEFPTQRMYETARDKANDGEMAETYEGSQGTQFFSGKQKKRHKPIKNTVTGGRFKPDARYKLLGEMGDIREYATKEVEAEHKYPLYHYVGLKLKSH